jgi:cyclic pyranopterin phosphate synthase
MPAQGIELSPREDILSFEEIARVARVGAKLGLKKIRLTGGEPTVRRNLPDLVSMLNGFEGIEEIAMTTNAALLEDLAAPLKNAGMSRLNISLDSLKRDRAAQIARRDIFEATLRGIEAAKREEFGLKFNAVIMRGTNDDELCELVDFANRYHAPIRFIEYMPMGAARFDERNQTVFASEMLELLAEKFDLRPVSGLATDPAKGYICQRSGARVGFITSMSDHFCETCNRMRLTAQGELRPCLHQNAEVDIRAILRSGGSDNDIENAYYEAAGLKWAGHRMNEVIPLFSSKEMVSIGG